MRKKATSTLRKYLKEVGICNVQVQLNETNTQIRKSMEL
jgi:hypothetical protein